MPSVGHGTQKVFLKVPATIITITTVMVIIFIITATILTVIITTTTDAFVHSGPSSWTTLHCLLIYEGV